MCVLWLQVASLDSNKRGTSRAFELVPGMAPSLNNIDASDDRTPPITTEDGDVSPKGSDAGSGTTASWSLFGTPNRDTVIAVGGEPETPGRSSAAAASEESSGSAPPADRKRAAEPELRPARRLRTGDRGQLGTVLGKLGGRSVFAQ